MVMYLLPWDGLSLSAGDPSLVVAWPSVEQCCFIPKCEPMFSSCWEAMSKIYKPTLQFIVFKKLITYITVIYQILVQLPVTK